MKLTGEIITRYSKKIYGFAYDALRDPDRAEELSQEIVLQLLRCAAKGQETDNTDGFVYTVCRHVFAKSLRRKYRSRETFDGEDINRIPSGENIQEQTEQKMLCGRLMREITRLSEKHRRVTVMFYFENIPGEEIARRLNIPHSTVRYYLGESRKKLREGINMNENLKFDIVKITAGHDGNCFDMTMHGLSDNPLVGNIAAACREKALTVEEISRETGVGAVYLEYYLDDLTKMDYMKKTGNRYVTNFYLRTPESMVKVRNYAYLNAAAPAETALEALKKRMDEILAIGFMGNCLDRDSLTWVFYGDLIHSLINSGFTYPLEGGRQYHDIPMPLRADGSSHWVWAAINGDPRKDVPTAEGFDEFDKSCLNTCGVKTRRLKLSDDDGANDGSNARMYYSWQLDYGTGWREFNDDELLELCRIRELILSGAAPAGHDKFVISRLSKNGYVTVTEGKAKLNVPYMTKEEHKKYRGIIESVCAELGRDFLLPYIKGMGETVEKDIPAHLDSDMRFYYKYSDANLWSFMHIIKYKGLLKMPESFENSAFCTLIYEG